MAEKRYRIVIEVSATAEAPPSGTNLLRLGADVIASVQVSGFSPCWISLKEVRGNVRETVEKKECPQGN